VNPPRTRVAKQGLSNETTLGRRTKARRLSLFWSLARLRPRLGFGRALLWWLVAGPGIESIGPTRSAYTWRWPKMLVFTRFSVLHAAFFSRGEISRFYFSILGLQSANKRSEMQSGTWAHPTNWWPSQIYLYWLNNEQPYFDRAQFSPVK
jgi:hypothetical protein